MTDRKLEEEVIQDFRANTEEYWRTRGDYDEVHALLLHWEDDDLNVAPEVSKLRDILDENFRYSTKVFRIPSDHPRAKLQVELSTFLDKNSLLPRSLTIIYYAGHAGEPDKRKPFNEGRSYWRAKRSDGPSLDWFELQLLLKTAAGDVLIILDCCYAAQKTRDGRDDTKMEVLAASGYGSRTPGPGKISFTSVLIRRLREHASSIAQNPNHPHLTVRGLHKRMFDERVTLGLTESPYYCDLSNEDHPSIALKPLEKSLPSGFERRTAKPSSTVLLRVSLIDDPTGLQLANWLKSYAPRGVHAVDIEGIVLKARRLQGLSGEYKDFFPGSTLSKLSEAAQREIAEKLMELDQTVSNSVSAAASSAQPQSNSHIEQRSAQQALEAISAVVDNVCETYQDRLLLDVNGNVEVDAAVKAVDAEDLLSLQGYIQGYHKDMPPASELDSDELRPTMKHDGSIFEHCKDMDSPHFIFGEFRGRRVFIEVFHYEPAEDAEGAAQDVPVNTWKQFSRMVALLSQQKRVAFHILQCLGYVHIRDRHELQLVFELGEKQSGAQECKTLVELLNTIKRVPLGQRLALAHSITTAVLNLHRVGWVHKELRSDNIVIFRSGNKVDTGRYTANSEAPDYDFATPYLFGFEYSRPEDEETAKTPDFNTDTLIYKHPARWGAPTAYFTKIHDVYSLGIILLEVAFWKQAALLPFAKNLKSRRPNLNPVTFRNEAIKEVNKNLPHQVGTVFTEVVISCLRFGEHTSGMNPLDSHNWFKTHILEKIAQMVGRM
ncbi:hypothetical protein BJ508DRAFT_415189 [Ascobolus immersus RN42]|uniref:Protein kinase domain-containing protein n=1 Tax=Ascobolus immersus RN42 TaxID=1160509 RepID=A0A3N4I5L5_ASCIM|nr:hypothetical protein BJ508DRAFT_415189 [Ascobolus immersus RN42]